MWFQKNRLLASCALALVVALLAADPAAAQGSVTPSFGDGKLTLIGEGYRPGERVEMTVRVAGATHRFTATADARGRFRLETGLVVPPMSSVEIEARDEQGLTQATITSAPGLPPPPASAPPPAVPPTTGAPPAVAAPPAGLPPEVAQPRIPTQLPRTGGPADPPIFPQVVAAGAVLLWLGAAARLRATRRQG